MEPLTERLALEPLAVRPELVALERPELVALEQPAMRLELVGLEQLVVRPELVQATAMTTCNSDCVNTCKGVIIKVL